MKVRIKRKLLIKTEVNPPNLYLTRTFVIISPFSHFQHTHRSTFDSRYLNTYFIFFLCLFQRFLWYLTKLLLMENVSTASATSNNKYTKQSDVLLKETLGRRRPGQQSGRKADLNKSDFELMRHAYDINAKRISKLEQVVQQLSSELVDDSSSGRRMNRSKRQPLMKLADKR